MERTGSDEEFELALAASMRSLEEDEARRRLAGHGEALIDIDIDPLEQERQEKIKKIIREYSHPSSLNSLGLQQQHQLVPSGPQRFSENIPLYRAPAPPSTPVSYGWSQHPLAPGAFPPTSELAYSTLSSSCSTPSAYSSAPLLSRPLPDPLPSGRLPPPPQIPPRLRQLSESATRGVDPSLFLSRRSHHLPSEHLPTPLVPPHQHRPPQQQLQPVHMRLPATGVPQPHQPRLSAVGPPPPQPASADRATPSAAVSSPFDFTAYSSPSALVVPYAMLSPRLLNGDLIDLGDPAVTYSLDGDEIWREFDPLYRRTAPVLPLSDNEEAVTARKSAPVTRGASVSESDTPAIAIRNAPNRKSLPARAPFSASCTPTVEERPKPRPVTFDDFVFQPQKPPRLQQLERLIASDCGSGPENGGEQPRQLRFHSSVASYLTTDADTIKIIVTKDYTWERGSGDGTSSLSLTCAANTRCDLLLHQILISLLPSDAGVDLNDYELKIFGLNEVLPYDSVLGRHLYVGQCLLLGKDVKLHVSRANAPGTSSGAISYCGSPDETITPVADAKCAVDPDALYNVLAKLRPETSHYEEAVLEKNSLEVSRRATNVKQLVKLLCTLCSNVQTMDVHAKLQAYLTATECTVVELRTELLGALYDVVEAYSRSTMSLNVLAPRLDPPVEARGVDHVTERLRVLVRSMHNLPEEWLRTIREFYITVHLYYGTTEIDVHRGNNAKRIQQGGLYPFVPLELCAVFDRQMCTLPREASFVIVVSGTSSISPNPATTPDTAAAATHAEPRRRHLAFTTLPLFDHDKCLRQGSQLLPLQLLAADELHTWGGRPLIESSEQPVLHVQLPIRTYTVTFPDVTADADAVEHSGRAKLDIYQLVPDETAELLDLIEGSSQHLSFDSEDAEHLWQRRYHLTNRPEALPLVLSAVSDWGIAFLPSIYEMLELWKPLTPVLAIQLLLPRYPDDRVRAAAVRWLREAAVEDSGECMLAFLPQLVEALRFEAAEDSHLARFLLQLSDKDGKFAFEIYWQLQQRIDHSRDGVATAYLARCRLLQETLLARHGSVGLEGAIARQRRLHDYLESVQAKLRDDSIPMDKMLLLREELGRLDGELLARPAALPILPSFTCSGVVVEDCTIFNSAARPIRVVFRGLHQNFAIIHKSGDDMRQDAMVLHLVSLMNEIWKEEHLDLKMILFRCMPVGCRKGMVELVSNCATLCEIQKKNGGIAGVFKEDVLNRWLRHNSTSEFDFKEALNNFQRSCAGWCVATYVLGIGDRHNDNILVTTRGHVFHIDFGKYLGDWQMAGVFRRDRVPFVFTREMFFVVNQGNQSTEDYQIFIDYCTKAFNYLRAKSTIILNVLRIMACSDIPGINLAAIEFVEEKLMLGVSDSDATAQFTQMLQQSLESMFPRLNFMVHLAVQVFTGRSSGDDPNSLSFVKELYNEGKDGRITRVIVTGMQKVKRPNKIYMYKMEVSRQDVQVSSIIYRSFDEINEFYEKLRAKFPSAPFRILNRTTAMRTNVSSVAQRRLFDVQRFIQDLFELKPDISHCDLVYTFFHSLHRDNSEFTNSEAEETNEFLNGASSHRACQLKVRLSYHEAKSDLHVFIGHAKHLVELPPSTPPDSYVKTYLHPDKEKRTKLKTPIIRSSCNPTYNIKLEYTFVESVEMLRMRILELSIWYAGALRDNSAVYATMYPMARLANVKPDRHGRRVIEQWLELRRVSGSGLAASAMVEHPRV